MKPSEQFRSELPKSSKRFPHMLADSANSIAVYTVLCILRGMKTQLGLGAMLEYMEEYLATIEKHNPKLKGAVLKAMSMMSIEKIYKEAIK